MLSIKNISKTYGKKVVLDDVSHQFGKGITALLGPNGAGKSTLMNIISTIVSADNGCVIYDDEIVNGKSKEYFKNLSVQFQNHPMNKVYNSDEYLEFCGILKNMSHKAIREQGSELLRYFGMEEYRKKKIGALSGGMKQRLALCGTFLGDPKVVLLDEPSVGLDIYEREELKSYLYDIKENRTIIISTHIVSDVENICDELLFVGQGKLLLNGKQKELISQLQGKVWDVSDCVSIGEIKNKYRSSGKSIVISDTCPCEGAVEKCPDLTDVYFGTMGKGNL